MRRTRDRARARVEAEVSAIVRELDVGPSACAIEARALSRTYVQGDDTIHALRGVDLALAPGEFVAVTGPSGSGKSTLLHILGGLTQADAGDVLVDGERITSLSDDELALVRRRRIGYVLQFSNLMPTLTAEENAGFPLLLDGISDARARAARSLERVGLRNRRTHRPSQLSGGEQQRVALARALVTDPAVVLADEPTGELDSQTGEEMLRLLRATADSGQSIVMVTHDGRAASYADRVIRLVDGAIVDGAIVDE